MEKEGREENERDGSGEKEKRASVAVRLPVPPYGGGEIPGKW